MEDNVLTRIAVKAAPCRTHANMISAATAMNLETFWKNRRSLFFLVLFLVLSLRMVRRLVNHDKDDIPDNKIGKMGWTSINE